MRIIIKYKKWWHRMIPYKRREVELMQAIVDHMSSKPEFQKKVSDMVLDKLMYGEDI